MAKIVLIVVILVVLRLLMWIGFKIVKVMASSNKEDKKQDKVVTKDIKQEPVQEYTPLSQEEKSSVNTQSSNTDFSVDDFRITDTGFTDHKDDEFFDYSAHMRNRKGREVPIDFDTDGDFADNFQYEPSSPEFDFLHKHQPKPRPKNLSQTLSDLPDEIKALMSSGLFDPKFK